MKKESGEIDSLWRKFEGLMKKSEESNKPREQALYKWNLVNFPVMCLTKVISSYKTRET